MKEFAIPLFSKPVANDPAALTSELVEARQAYDATREDVLRRAVERVGAVDATISDLEEERAALDQVIGAAA